MTRHAVLYLTASALSLLGNSDVVSAVAVAALPVVDLLTGRDGEAADDDGTVRDGVDLSVDVRDARVLPTAAPADGTPRAGGS